MYFKNDGEYTSIVEINGFKFKKIVMKEDSRVTVEVLDMDLNTVSFISVYDSSEIEDAEEVILADVYKYIENESEQRQRKIVLDAEAEQNANKELLDFDANEIEDAQFEEVKSVDGFIDVTEVETSPANESESEEDPF
ncbi:DUF1108 family protein [Staphylococcus pseudintermedius]|nr:DUF1108 family protein [Staphylococcus pseudintermedius]